MEPRAVVRLAGTDDCAHRDAYAGSMVAAAVPVGRVGDLGTEDQDLVRDSRSEQSARPFRQRLPAAINLIQVWANLGIGAWDDAKMNIAWPLLLGALALAAYGQARRVEASPLAAAVVAYLMASIPMLDAHAALAGYADLPLSVTFGLARHCVFRLGRHRRLATARAGGAFRRHGAFVQNPGHCLGSDTRAGSVGGPARTRARSQGVALGGGNRDRGARRGCVPICQAAQLHPQFLQGAPVGEFEFELRAGQLFRTR